MVQVAAIEDTRYEVPSSSTVTTAERISAAWLSAYADNVRPYVPSSRSNRETLSAYLADGALTEYLQVGDAEGVKRLDSPIVFPRSTPVTKELFVSLQYWIGEVKDLDAESFVAVLTDLNEQSLQETVELEMDDVSPDDRKLVIEGAIFYWSIGYRQNEAGTRFRTSLLRFRRLPVWRPEDLAEAAKRAAVRRAMLE